MIGLFGFSEVLEHLFSNKEEKYEAPQKVEGAARQFYLQPLLLIVREKWLVLRSSILGVFVGFLPGAGADIGAWVSTSFQQMRKKEEEEAEEDDRIILAGTSSNNSAVASAWIPALSLGLPGDTVTAIVLGVFLMKGITPGPLLFEQQPDLLWSLYLTFLLANLVLLPFYGFLTARMAAFLIKVPFKLLLSFITGLCIVGAFAINNSVFDVWIMAGMGVVLGPIMEQNFMVSAIKSKWDLMSFFERPLALGLMVGTLAIIFLGLRFRRRFVKSSSNQ